jgi:hypothetical protein
MPALPSIIPSKAVKTGNIFRNGRVWAMFDILLTADTISEARDKTSTGWKVKKTMIEICNSRKVSRNVDFAGSFLCLYTQCCVFVF